MNKAEFVAIMATKLDSSKKQAEEALAAFLETVHEVVESGDSLSLIGFGTFGVKARAAREGRNPTTGKVIKIPAKIAPYFKPGKALKDAANQASPTSKKAKAK